MIGDPNSVDLCPALKEETSVLLSLHTINGRVCESMSRNCVWRHNIQLAHWHSSMASLPAWLTDAGYTGTHMDLKSAFWTIHAAVRCSDLRLAIFIMKVITKLNPRMGDLEIHRRLQGVASEFLLRGGLNIYSVNHHLETAVEVNKLFRDVYPVDVSLNLVILITRERLQSAHTPLFRFVNATPSYLRIKDLRAECLEGATRTLRIKETLYSLATSNETRRTFGGRPQEDGTLWTAKSLLDIIAEYDSNLSEVALDCAQRTVDVIQRIEQDMAPRQGSKRKRKPKAKQPERKRESTKTHKR
jgi:hypothetical protein